MGRRAVGVIIAVLLAVTGTIALVLYVRGAENRALEGQRAVEVVVADAVIPRGTPVSEIDGLVRTERIPAAVQARGSIDDVAELGDTVAAVELLPGEQLSTLRFVEPGALASADDIAVPEGLQELTLAVEPQRVLGGEVAAGDRVGLIASFEPFTLEGVTLDPDLPLPDDADLPEQLPNTTGFLYHKVLVTDVLLDAAAPAPAPEEDPDPPELAAPGDVYVTLAVDAPQAERIVFAQEFGSLWLTLEPPEAIEDGTEQRTRGNAFP